MWLNHIVHTVGKVRPIVVIQLHVIFSAVVIEMARNCHLDFLLSEHDMHCTFLSAWHAWWCILQDCFLFFPSDLLTDVCTCQCPPLTCPDDFYTVFILFALYLFIVLSSLHVLDSSTTVSLPSLDHLQSNVNCVSPIKTCIFPFIHNTTGLEFWSQWLTDWGGSTSGANWGWSYRPWGWGVGLGLVG